MRNNMFTSALIDEVMAHPYYSPEGLAFEHQHKPDGLPMVHPMRDGSQPDMLDRSVDCVSPSQELDGKTRNSTRRRIQVAVCLPYSRHMIRSSLIPTVQSLSQKKDQVQR